LEEKCLASSVKMMVGDVEDLYEVWDTLDAFITRPGKYIVEALDTIMKFRVY
jgi:Mg2+/Co2+ transporter CorC